MPTYSYRNDFQPLGLPRFQGKFSRLFQVLRPSLEKLICLPRINHIYAQAASAPDQWHFLDALLQALQVGYEVTPAELQRLPAQGAAVVVANHPFGGIEGIMLPALLGRVRRDVKILANYLLRPVRELQDLFIYVDPFGGKEATRSNLAGLREARRWLQRGGMLGVFPAGEVSHLDWRQRQIADPVWSTTVAGLIRQSRAQAVPLFFAGHNGPVFQCLGLVHPLLRTALLPREAVNKRGKTIQVKIGRSIDPGALQSLGSDQEATAFLRQRTYMLQGNFPSSGLKLGRLARLPRKKPAGPEPVLPPQDPRLMAREISQLPPSQTLVRAGHLCVYGAQAEQIPLLLQEIGRLREITFREVQEGTGKAIDLDRFDAHYLHLFLWNHETQELVGAYRLGQTDRIMAAGGTGGLYTATLFDFNDQFLKEIYPALELGRSFICGKYQKNYTALLLLWKGIGRFVVQNPQYQNLFGPVSISNAYNEFSQGLLAAWLEMHTFLPELAQYIIPKNPLAATGHRREDWRQALAGTRGVEEISALLADVDPKHQGMPILLKQYLKLGGKLLGFNRDALFNNVLDGLILVDLLQTPRPVLQRYMGKEGLTNFLQYHHPPLPSGQASPYSLERLPWAEKTGAANKQLT